MGVYAVAGSTFEYYNVFFFRFFSLVLVRPVTHILPRVGFDRCAGVAGSRGPRGVPQHVRRPFLGSQGESTAPLPRFPAVPH